jgi:hypothetical protein
MVSDCSARRSQASPTLPGFDAVRPPCAHAAQVYAGRASGIPVPQDLQRPLDAVATTLGSLPL